MMLKHSLLLLVALGATTVGTHAQVISGSVVGNETQLPGSAQDYYFFAAVGASYQSGNTPDAGVQTDFSLTNHVGEAYTGDGRYSTLETPAGNTTQTGILFGRTTNTYQDLVTLTLGTGSTTFNYSDFDLYILVGNGSGDGSVRDSGFQIVDGSASSTVTFSDANSDLTKGTVLDFHITGATAGSSFELEASSPDGLPYVGAVSLESNAVPEPSTYAMVLGGVALFALALRRRLLAAW